MNFFDSGEIIENDTIFVFFGIPWDDLTSIENTNSSKSPQKIRKITENLALTTEMGFEIPKLKFVDAGNVLIDPNNIEKNILEIDDFVKSLFDKKKDIIPIMIQSKIIESGKRTTAARGNNKNIWIMACPECRLLFFNYQK